MSIREAAGKPAGRRRSGGAPRVGVLALQGDFAAHAAMLEGCGARAEEVRRPVALGGLDALVIPGGESTTLLMHMSFDPTWWDALEAFRAGGGGILGTCAGLILLASRVESPPQRSLGFLDVTVTRNAYGRQRESFEEAVAWRDGRPLEAVFIRAPRISAVGDGVEILAARGEEPVLVARDRILGATFHPEMTADDSVHRLLLARTRGRTDA